MVEGFEQHFLSLDVQASQNTLLNILPKFSSKSNVVSARAMSVDERIYKCHESWIPFSGFSIHINELHTFKTNSKQYIHNVVLYSKI